MDIAGAIVGLIVAIAWAEAAAWLPRLTRRIIRMSARRLEPELRLRMEEEWLRYVLDMPGTLGPFLAGCQCLLASFKISPVRVGISVHRRKLAAKWSSSVRRPFQARDFFIHDGKRLHRIRLAARLQIVLIIVGALLSAWSAYSAIELFLA